MKPIREFKGIHLLYTSIPFKILPTNFTIDVKNYVHSEPRDHIVAEDEENSTFCEKNVSQGSHYSFLKVSKVKRVHFNTELLVFPVREETFNTTSQCLTTKLGLDHKSLGIKCKRATVVATVLAILLILVTGGNIYLGWRKVQEMEMTK
ncbi:hypothetical protein SUGI_0844890 [Cryptomeria japonica]|nr:hypothetical protein SUGI_0844890 [Cryptomeria japonica]